jgi:hypothetical protein
MDPRFLGEYGEGVTITADGRRRARQAVVRLVHRVEMANAAADRWLDALAGEVASARHLPVVVHAVACRARALAGGDSGAEAATARVRTRAGQWLVARASTLGEGPATRIAVLLELGPPARTGSADRRRLRLH